MPSLRRTQDRGQPMRAFVMLTAVLALTLAGCLGGPTPEVKETWARTPGMGEWNMTKEEKIAKDDGICRGYGAQPGTPAYIQCRATQDQRRDAIMLSDSGAPAPVVNPAGGVPRSDAPVLRNTLPQTVRCQTIGMRTVCQ
jgi:hypothetical protein